MQLTYDYATPVALPGGKVDISFDEVVARINEEEDGAMHYGLAVVNGTTAGSQVKKPTSSSTAANIVGVVIANANTEQDMNGNIVIKNKATLGVMVRGNIWARTVDTTAPTAGTTAYVVPSGDDAGSFTASANNGKSGDDKVEYLDIGAKFGNKAEVDTDGGIAIVSLG